MIKPPTLQMIPLAELRMDVQNPRLSPTSAGGIDPLWSMIQNQKGKLLALARDISDYGLSPQDLMLVVSESEGSYTVLDGNRRLAALKMLQGPARAEEQLTSDELRAWKQLAAIAAVPEAIMCSVVQSRAEAEVWVKRRHGGELKGAGQVTWGALEKARDQERQGSPDPTLEVLEFVFQYGSLPAHQRGAIWDIKFTNLERLIEFQDVQHLIGIDVEGGHVRTCLGRDEVIKGLQALVEDVLDPETKVDDFKTSEMARARVADYPRTGRPSPHAVRGPWVLLAQAPESLGLSEPAEVLVADAPREEDNGQAPEGVQPTDEGKSTDGQASEGVRPTAKGQSTDDPLSAEAAGEVDASATRSLAGDKAPATGVGKKEGAVERATPGREAEPSAKRKTLIPSKSKLYVDQPRIDNIYRELKKLNVQDFPNAVAVLMRVFVELSVDNYIVRFKVQIPSPKTKGDQEGDQPRPEYRGPDLKMRVLAVRDHLKDRPGLDKKATLPVEKIVSGKLYVQSITTLNQFIHGENMVPGPDDLKAGWTSIQPFMEALWPQPSK